MKTLKITTDRKVKYRVTDESFGLEAIVGEIREAFLVASDGTRNLLYHPRGTVPNECASFEICRHVRGVYESCSEDGDGGYVNVTNRKGVTLKEI
jgi:hypothetical protein